MNMIAEAPEGSLRFNWTALGVFVTAVALLLSATTVIYATISAKMISDLRRDVIAADAALERRIVASETIHGQYDRRIDDLHAEVRRLRDTDDAFRRDYEQLLKERSRR